MAIRELATPDSPHKKPTGKSREPDLSVFSNGRKIATCSKEAMARPAIKVRLFGREKLFSLAASCAA